MERNKIGAPNNDSTVLAVGLVCQPSFIGLDTG
jgi:hypothetical protein